MNNKMYPPTAGYWSGRVTPAQQRDTTSLFDKYATPLHDMLYDSDLVGRARPEESSYWSGTVSPEQQRPTKPQSLSGLKSVAEMLPFVGPGMAYDDLAADPTDLTKILNAAISTPPGGAAVSKGLGGLGAILGSLILPKRLANAKELDLLKQAERMRGKRTPEEIWQKTKWNLEPPPGSMVMGDVEPQFEPFSRPTVNQNPMTRFRQMKQAERNLSVPNSLYQGSADEFADLKDIISGEEALNRVPTLRDKLMVGFNIRNETNHQPMLDVINLDVRNPLDINNHLFHEVDHSIKDYMGLSAGSDWKNDANYWVNAGEVAARNSELRWKQDRDWLAARHPKHTQDVPNKYQTTRRGDPSSFAEWKYLFDNQSDVYQQNQWLLYGPPPNPNFKDIEDLRDFINNNMTFDRYNPWDK